MHHLSRERTLPSPFTALLCTLFLILTACAPAHHKATPDDGLELRLLHVNDTHAFLAGIGDRMNACFEATDCRGGLARISAAIRAARQEQDNIIALDAGDQFQGTLFYSVNKWPMIAAADALLPYDAMTLGNHEFDEGCRELARFLEAQPLPVLAANLVPQQGCPLADAHIPTFSQMGAPDVVHGALLSVAQSNTAEEGRFSAGLVEAILKGARPRDLSPVFESPVSMALNLFMATLIGWNPPLEVLAAVDEFYQEMK